MAKTLGIIGGIGPESTIDYYRSLIAQHRAERPDDCQPSIIINSIDLKRMLGFIAADQLSDLVEFLLEEIHRLSAAGANLALMAANTPHLVFDDVARASPIPMISIVEATCEHVRRLG